jgi:2-polyprenyl-6-methoxyphenol hydroxylase-like FAD-dependent oxidoreductase
MTDVQRVLIVGGGIAGMSLAVALARNGIASEIVEADPDWRVHGAGITITGPTLRAFDALGLLDRIAADGFCYDATRVCDTDGRVIIPSRVSGRPLGPRIPNGGGILRPVLHDILSEATRVAGAKVRLGVTVVAIAQDGQEVAATLSDRSECIADLIVGADGIHSGVRGLMFPDAPAPALTGQGCWRAVLPRPPEIEGAYVFVGPVKAGIVPVSREKMYLFLLQNAPDGRRLPEERFAELLAARLDGFGGALGAAREALGPSSQINYRPLEKLLLPQPWHRRRAILVGDAAHATTPHLASGAGLAVEDALVLSELLASDLRLEDALQAFTARRYARCRMVVENSARLGEMEMRHAPGEEQAELQRASMLALNATI